MEIIRVIAMPDLAVTAAWAVLVLVTLVLATRHQAGPPCAEDAIGARRRQGAGRGEVRPTAPGALGLALLVALLGGGASVGCAPPARETGRPVAAATIAPLADLAARVAGPGWEVRTVMPPGVSEHVFEPDPREVRAVAPARLVVVAGGGLDDWVRKLLQACAPGVPVFDAGAAVGIHAPKGGAGGHGHGASHGGGGELDEEPHWWLSAALAARSLAPMAEAFARVDPAGAAGYRERAARETEELLALDRQIAAELAPFRGRRFVSAHLAWSQFAARYGLVPVGAVEPVPGREPSPRDLKELIDAARHGGSGALFTEPQFPPGAARVIAREAGIRLTTVDPIGGVPGRETYPELMRFNADAFARGLSGEGP